MCRGSIEVMRGNRDYDHATKLLLVCENCGEVASEWSSRRAETKKRCNPFDINILAGRAMLSNGNSQTAMNDLFATMGLFDCGMHKKGFRTISKIH